MHAHLDGTRLHPEGQNEETGEHQTPRTDMKMHSPPPAQPAMLVHCRRRRAGMPKVRTGCLTCKNRRVKCDEQKPACRRCAKFGVTCGGYAKPPPRFIEATLPKQQQQHQQQQQQQQPVRDAAARQILPRVQPPSPRPGPFAVTFSAPQDVAYFDTFRNQCVADLCGYWPSDFWSRHVLSEALREPCVRQSILSIGAMSHARRSAPPRPQPASLLGAVAPTPAPPQGRLKADNTHYETAIRYHMKALSMFRRSLSQPDQPMSARNVLIASMLFIIFELLLGNIQAADELLTNAIVLLKDSIKVFRDKLKTHGSLNDSSIPPIYQDADDIAYILPQVASVCTFVPQCSSQQKNCTLLTFEQADDGLPGPVSQLALKDLLESWNQFFVRAMIFVCRGIGYFLNQHPFDKKRMYKRKQQFMDRLAGWRTLLDEYAARPDMQEAPGRDNLRERAGFKLIDVYHTYCTCVVACCLDSQEWMYSTFEPQFIDMLDQCDAIRAMMPAAANTRFFFDIGLMLITVTTAMKCRRHDVRLRAVEAIRTLPWREGAWDPDTLVAGLTALIDMEERARDPVTGIIPANCMWWWHTCAVTRDEATGQRKLAATYTRLVPSKSGNPVRIQLWLDLPEE